jgi:uncharacterized lipoprotein YddW (UPF0748 family)
MNRNEFIKTSVIGLAGLTLARPFALGYSSVANFPENWAWTSGSLRTPPDKWKELFDRLVKGNVGGLLIQGGNDFYEKTAPLAKKAGMQLHTWRVTMMRGEYMKDHPEWYAVNRLGQSVVDNPPYVGYYRWLCPSHPEVRELLIKDYTELASIPDVNGVHLDYVRYCDQYLPIGLQPRYNLVQDHEMPEYDYCYCPLCRKTFKEQSGYDPLDKPDPTTDDLWRRFRLDQLVKLVQDLVKAIHEKNSIITGAVFPTPQMSRVMVRQDWSRFNLDAYFPMLYHNYYQEPTSWIGKCIADARKEVHATTPIYAGVMMNPSVFTPHVLSKTMRQTRKAGAQGICSFTVHGLKEEQLEVFTEEERGG